MPTRSGLIAADRNAVPALSADPVGTEAERHFSKSGLPRYQEERRDWKATLRAYSTDDQKESLWLFEERQPGGKWSHIQFILYLNPE